MDKKTANELKRSCKCTDIIFCETRCGVVPEYKCERYGVLKTQGVDVTKERD